MATFSSKYSKEIYCNMDIHSLNSPTEKNNTYPHAKLNTIFKIGNEIITTIITENNENKSAETICIQIV